MATPPRLVSSQKSCFHFHHCKEATNFIIYIPFNPLKFRKDMTLNNNKIMKKSPHSNIISLPFSLCFTVFHCFSRWCFFASLSPPNMGGIKASPDSCCRKKFGRKILTNAGKRPRAPRLMVLDGVNIYIYILYICITPISGRKSMGNLGLWPYL